MSEKASERMGKKNVVFTKDGVKVGVKQVQNEKYVDKTQSYVVKAWNLAQEEEAYVSSHTTQKTLPKHSSTHAR